MNGDDELVLSGIEKSFPRAGRTPLRVLHDVSLSAAAGEFLVIVGPSGCGKTTLLRILLGLSPHDAGDIQVPRNLKVATAYVAQEPLLYPWRTVLQNACLALEARAALTAPAVESVAQLLGRYGLGDFLDARPRQLSGGMAQRVAVVRALAMKPRLLVCDEPFSAVDFVTRLDLSTRFRQICKISGTTVVFVTHNIEEAIFLGDRVVVLSSAPSRVMAVHTIDTAMSKDSAVALRNDRRYASLFEQIWSDLERGQEHVER